MKKIISKAILSSSFAVIFSATAATPVAAPLQAKTLTPQQLIAQKITAKEIKPGLYNLCTSAGSCGVYNLNSGIYRSTDKVSGK